MCSFTHYNTIKAAVKPLSFMNIALDPHGFVNCLSLLLLSSFNPSLCFQSLQLSTFQGASERREGGGTKGGKCPTNCSPRGSTGVTSLSNWDQEGGITAA